MYSDAVKRLLASPKNGRRGSHYNCEGSAENEVKCRHNPKRSVKNRAKFQLCVKDGVILDARWEVFGDPIVYAVCSWCVSHLVYNDIPALTNVITPERAALELDITDALDIRAGCTTAIQALINALKDYENQQDGS